MNVHRAVVRPLLLTLLAVAVACGSGSKPAETDTIPPELSGISPADGSGDVWPTTSISLTFSEAMAPGSLQVIAGPTVDLGAAVWSADHRTATFSPPGPLAFDTLYTLSVSATDVAGNPLPGASAASFRTAACTTVAVSPGGSDAPTDSAIRLTFSRAMVTAGVQVAATDGGSALTLGTGAWSAGDTVLTFSPPRRMAPSTTYTVTVSGGDTRGGTLSSASATFTTAAPTVSVIDVSSEGSSGFGFGTASGEVLRYQTFVAGDLGTGLAADLIVRKMTDGMQSDVTVKLYATTGGAHPQPTGPALAEGLLAASQVTTDFRAFRVPLSYAGLEPGVPYAVVLGQLQPQADHYEWRTGTGPAGLAFGKGNGTGWTDESGKDGWLRLVVTDGTAPVRATVEILPDPGQGVGFGAPYAANAEVKRWQTFTATDLPNLEAVEVKVRRFGSGTSQTGLTVELYATDGAGCPTGQALAAVAVPASRIASTATVVGAPLHYRGLVSGSRYAVVLGQVSPRADQYQWTAFDHGADGQTFGKWDGTAWHFENQLRDGWVRAHVTADPGPEPSVVDHTAFAAGSGYGFGDQAGAGNEVKRWHTFVAAAPHLTGVDVRVRKLGPGTGQSDITVEIYALDAGKPGWSPVASGRIAAAAVGSSFTTVQAVLDSYAGYEGRWGLVPGRGYAVVLGQETPQADHYEWLAVGAVGTTTRGKWDGTAWSTPSSGALWMRVTGDDLPPPRSYLQVSSDVSGPAGAFGDVPGAGREVKRYQTFVAGPYLNLEGPVATLRTLGGGTPSDVTVELTRASAGLPGATVLKSATLRQSYVTGTCTPIWTNLSFPGLLPGATYALALGQVTPQTARYEWCSSGNPGVAGLHSGSWDGTSWSDETATAGTGALYLEVTR